MTTKNNKPLLTVVANKYDPAFSRAFSDLEPDIRDLPRIARLATQQLYKAVGQLKIANGKYIEVPDAGDTELAIVAAEIMLRMARELEQTYDRFHAAASSPPDEQ
jgi:hypothetical protein